MKTASTLCLAAALVGGVSGQRLLQGVTDLEFNTFSMGGAEGDEGGSTSADMLVQALEEDSQIKVVGAVELGEFSCEALETAEDASAVSMTIHKERIVADKTSYTTKDGDSFSDGIVRHIWTGVVSDPGQADDEAAPRTVSLSWGDDCNVESFLLKITKQNLDGTTSMVKTVPCIDSSKTTCLVEVLAQFEEPGEALMPEDYGASAVDATEPAGRRMQEGADEAEYTVIDVMVLYTDQAREVLGGVSHIQMVTYLLESIVMTNQAFINSEASVRFNAVSIDKAPFDEPSGSGVKTLVAATFDAAIGALRDLAQADLVQIIGQFDDGACGWGWRFYNAAYGYSIVKPTCLDNLVHIHEYGHNMGCDHNRESVIRPETEYSHGLRYCDGLLPYRTVMSYSCGTPIANYFSNPDVSYFGRPTGTVTEDNVRTLEDNMVAVSNYRGMVVDPPTPAPITSTLPPTMMPTEPPTMMPTEPPTVPPTMAPYTEVDPTPYFSVGCYKDSNTDRVLTGPEFKGDAAMTAERCGMLCEGSAYFGTEYSNECFCGPSTDDPTRKGTATCNFPCSGDADEKCGGNNAISLYKYITYPLVGCFKDSRDRVLSGETFSSSDMTTKVCADFCSGSAYFGTEYGVECFCSEASDDPMELGDATCDFPCEGDETETCGGSFAISVYQYPDILLVPTPTFLGCWGDSKGGRIMMNQQTNPSMTTDICQGLCTSYPFFGTQYGVECWCGDEETDYETYGASSACDFDCGGDASETCGGRNAMSVWEY